MIESLTLRVLFIEDDEETARQIEEYFVDWKHGGLRLRGDICNDFHDGLVRLESERFDLLVLDVLKGKADANDEAGRDAFDSIKARRFIPVIFYTAVTDRVLDLKSAVVRVVSKGSGMRELEIALAEQIDSGLLRINRELNLHFESMIRDYLWDFVPQHWDELHGTEEGEATLAYLLSRRIASSLDAVGADRLANRLGSAGGSGGGVEGKVHPLRYYIIPPDLDGYRTGDILREGEPHSFWVVLTPWCDLVPRGTEPQKAEHVLLAKCVALEEFQESKWWDGGQPSSRLLSLLRTPAGRPEGRQEGRYYFLPGVLGIPDLVIDYQQTITIEFGKLPGYYKIATLDSPFAESVSSRHLQFLGRVGTPDLDTNRVVVRLRAERAGGQADDGTES